MCTKLVYWSFGQITNVYQIGLLGRRSFLFGTTQFLPFLIQLRWIMVVLVIMVSIDFTFKIDDSVCWTSTQMMMVMMVMMTMMLLMLMMMMTSDFFS